VRNPCAAKIFLFSFLALLLALILPCSCIAPVAPSPPSSPVPSYQSNSYKGQLHCHSTNNDGADTPTALETAYLNAGYDFICLTDHDMLTPDPNVAGILHVNGVEESPSSGHIGNIGCTAQSTKTNSQDIIDDIKADDALASLCHPHGTIGYTDEKIISLEDYQLIEIWNKSAQDVASTGLAEDLWDAALTAGKPIWGVAVDDCHNIAGIAFNKGWVVIYADSLTLANVKESLRSGNFYSTEGPTLSISLSGDTITATTGASATIIFIGKGGKTLKSTASTTSETYTIKGNERYVRVKVTRDSDSLRAWSQPIFVQLMK